MDKLIPFAIENWPFVLLFVCLLVAYFFFEFKDKAYGVTALSSQNAVQIINQKNAVVIDIRDKTAFDNGHVTRAVHCPQSDLVDRALSIQKNLKDPVVIVCDNGMQSKKSAAHLKKMGYEAVYTIKEGLNAWQKDQLPLVKG